MGTILATFLFLFYLFQNKKLNTSVYLSEVEIPLDTVV